MTGFGMRARVVKAAWSSTVRAEIAANDFPAISFTSAPAANTRSPPQMTTAPARSSAPT
jgi:hypothetical protein